jgi:hypothetical protein
MRGSPAPWGVTWLSLVAATALTACGDSSPDPSPDPVRPQPQTTDGSWFEDPATPTANKPRVIYPSRRGQSAPLREIMAQPPQPTSGEPRVMPDLRPPVRRDRRAVDPTSPDSTIQLSVDGNKAAPAPTLSFDGLSNADNAAAVGFQVWPPDVNGDVGPNHYVQWVNLSIAVYDKSGNLMSGPSPGNTPWTGFGGPCEAQNDGDPIVVYDQLADRWVFSQFALFTAEGGHQCFAVSQTPDPLGPYYLYDYVFSPGGALNDYPKISVWPDGYYITVNEFDASFAFRAAVAGAVDREAMLLGLPAALVRFDVRSPDTAETVFSLQPSHLEGLVPPPAGAPNYIVQAFDDEAWSATPDAGGDRYNVWAMHVDWTDPENLSTLAGPIELPTEEFDSELCGFSRSCVQTPEGGALDALSVMTMYRAAYRNLGTHEALVINHTVDVGGDRAGVRWAELRDLTAAPALHQVGTFAPDDGLSRWMGSIAMDGRGNLAVGYSVASTTTYPGLRYAARLADDPVGELSQGEAVIVDGSSTQIGIERWGDYFSMSVDETDDCTFWFAGEYSSSVTPGDWRTRIASFQLPLCTATEIGRVEGVVTDADGDPLPGARVGAGAFSTVAAADGHYRLTLPAGTYDVTASAFGYLPQTATGLVVVDEGTITADFALDAAPMVSVAGWVYDGSDAGWPLYAKVTFTTPGAPPQVAFTDPGTGWYDLELPAGTDFTATVEALVPGYEGESRPITPGPSDVLAHFGLEVNAGTCDALGYARLSAPLGAESFEGAFPPAGWTVETSTTGCAGEPGWSNADPLLRGNLTGGTGAFAVADADQCGPEVQMSTTLTSPPIDLSTLAADEGLEIAFAQDLLTLPGTSARVEVFDGATWHVVANQTSDRRGPQRVAFGTSLANGATTARVRFVYEAGWDWWWQIDELALARTSCEYRLGGLVWGAITDRNTDLPVVGASVTAPGEPAVTSFATPADEAQPDGLYVAFMPLPGRIEASAPKYRAVGRDVTPQVNGATRANMSLRAGRITIDPASIEVRVPIGGTATATLTLTNDGTAPATVEFLELAGPPVARPTTGPFAPPGRRLGPKRMLDRDAQGVRDVQPPPSAPLLAAGEVGRRFDPALAAPWGVGFDAATSTGWIGNIAALGGDDHLYGYTPTGAPTGGVIDGSSYGSIFGADLAYDSRNGTLWQVNVGGGDCIHEVSPATGTVTGNTICPAFGTSERGLAYDPVTDTFFAGSWNDARIVQFDRSGAILRAVQTGLNISGLAYNPTTGHLFVMVNDAAATPDVFVLDEDLALIGQFELTEGGAPAFGDYAGAALELDCDGNLWAVDQATRTVVIADSGEEGGCGADLDWISLAPSSVTVPTGGTRTVTVTIDAGDLPPGLYSAQLLPLTDTPYDVPAVSVRATVAFLDVPEGSYGDAEIHALAGAGISYGCGAGNFCPDAPLTRRVFAVWGLRSVFGATYAPGPAFGLMFDDVSPESFGADFVEAGAEAGYFAACGDGMFCPDATVTRGEAATTLLKLREGASYAPPPAEGVFDDVSPALAPFAEDAWRRGLIDACGPTSFCPEAGTTRADNAIWLVRTFAFPMYL